MLSSLRNALVLLLLTILVAAGGLKAVDIYVGERRERPIPSDPIEKLKFLCPYSGFHIQRSLTLNEFAKGTLNYWLKGLDLRSPPAKAAGEFRVLLIGPRASNQFDLAKLLEVRVSRGLERTGRSVRVIDLSMYGSVLYQNYLVLNWAGHAFEPDMILAYAGFMEWVVPYYFERLPGVHCGFTTQVAANMYFARAWEIPGKLQLLNDWFPNIMTRTNVGFALKGFFDFDYFVERGREGYIVHRGLRFSGKREMFDRYAIPFFIHALKSIKRDFPGIPIVLAWQAVELAPDEFAPFGNPREVLGNDFYNGMYERAKQELNGYMNQEWFFINVHQSLTQDSRHIGFDLTEEGQVIVADAIAPMLGAAIERSLFPKGKKR